MVISFAAAYYTSVRCTNAVCKPSIQDKHVSVAATPGSAMMHLVCVNVLDMNGRRHGLVLDGDVETAMKCLHPDLQLLEVLAYCPVWVCDYWRAWDRWHHLRGPESMVLAPFQSPSLTFDTRLELDVRQMLRQGYVPPLLSMWIWGEQISCREIARNLADFNAKEAVAKVNHPRQVIEGWSHERRIAWLIRYRKFDPVQVVKYKVMVQAANGTSAMCRWIIGDGTHRFVAALVAGDEFIPAVTQARWAEELITNGMARTVTRCNSGVSEG